MAILMMAIGMPISAQDARQRTPETVIQDVLAQMPIQKQADFNRELGYVVDAAPQSIILLAKMMKPVEKQANNLVEYAISGAVAVASTDNAKRQAVAEGLKKAIPSAVDQTAKEFLQAQLRLLSTQDDVTYVTHKGAATYTEAYDKLVALGDDAGKQIVKNVKSKDRALRMQALKFATDHGLVNDELIKNVAKRYSSSKTDGKVDILNWLGDNKVESQQPLMLKALKEGGEPAAAAIEALGRIGGESAVSALISALGTDQDAAAMEALRSVRQDISAPVTAALNTASGAQLVSLINLASARRIKSAVGKVFDLTASSDSKVAEAAYAALPGVVTAKDVDRVAAMLDKAPANLVPLCQRTLQASVSSMTPGAQYDAISALIDKAAQPARLYEPLSAVGTDKSVQKLENIWNEKNDAQAIAALRKSQNYWAYRPLLKSAQAGDAQSLDAFINIINQKETNVDKRDIALKQAMELSKTVAQKKRVLNALGVTPTRNAFILAGQYLTDNEVKYDAAVAEKNIATKTTEEIEYDIMNRNLSVAIDVLKATGNADDGYAVDEIKKLLAELKPSPVYVLTEEEKKEGFEILYDGTNLDKWTGNKDAYLSINGSINVTANYGNGGNLYTVKEYRDFVLRFEFCFLRPGVNNGIGIRTPMGVDAAYYGMCESQILDHDDPIYANLQPYQVHGSVYGIIPAKRVKHKPLGEWSTEEIRVKGDHITVIVNGETIIDGDIRKACQGHNVAPDGSDKNPYTADHKNHPGMFNKTGHIGFLGHGAGLKYRNVRVLDLTKTKK